MAKMNAAPLKLEDGPRAHRIIETICDCPGMPPAPKAFAVSVKDKRRDAVHLVPFHLSCKMGLQPFNREGRRNLPHETSRIRKSGLDGEDTALFNIFTIGRVFEHFTDNPAAIIQRVSCFKERRNIQHIRNAVAAREVKNGERHKRIFCFRD